MGNEASSPVEIVTSNVALHGGGGAYLNNSTSSNNNGSSGYNQGTTLRTRSASSDINNNNNNNTGLSHGRITTSSNSQQQQQQQQYNTDKNTSSTPAATTTQTTFGAEETLELTYQETKHHFQELQRQAVDLSSRGLNGNKMASNTFNSILGVCMSHGALQQVGSTEGGVLQHQQQQQRQQGVGGGGGSVKRSLVQELTICGDGNVEEGEEVVEEIVNGGDDNDIYGTEKIEEDDGTNITQDITPDGSLATVEGKTGDGSGRPPYPKSVRGSNNNNNNSSNFAPWSLSSPDQESNPTSPLTAVLNSVVPQDAFQKKTKQKQHNHLKINTDRDTTFNHNNNNSGTTSTIHINNNSGATNDIHRIAKSGDWDSLRTRLTSLNDYDKAMKLVGQVDERGRTALMLACRHGDSFPPDVARLLLVADNKSASVYVLQANGGRQYCLHVAASSGCSLEVLQILHGAYPKMASAVDGNGNMPLHLAVNSGRYRSVVSQLNVRGDDDSDSGTIMTLDNESITQGSLKSSLQLTPKSAEKGDAVSGSGSGSNNNTSPQDVSGSKCILVDGIPQQPQEQQQQQHQPNSYPTNSILVSVCNFLATAYPAALTHRNRRGETPLLLAIYCRSHTDVLSLLIHHNHKALTASPSKTPPRAVGSEAVKICDEFGSYPIHFCDRAASSIGIVYDMARLHPEGITKKNNLGDTPLYAAMHDECDISVLRALLEHCPRPKETLDSKNVHEINILQYGWDGLVATRIVAAEDQDAEDIRVRNSRGIIETATGPSDIIGSHVGEWWEKATLLLKACYHDTSNLDGPDQDPDYVGDDNRLWRPVHAAAGTDCPPEMVKFVLQTHPGEAGNIDEDGNTPLHVGASLPDIVGLETIRLLHDAHPASAMIQNRNGYTPLHVACLHGAPMDVLQYLLDSSPEAAVVRNEQGQTPLFVSILMGASIDVLRILLRARADAIHIRDGKGMTPIGMAWHLLLSGKIVDDGKKKKKDSSESNKKSPTSPISSPPPIDPNREEARRGKSNIMSLAVARSSSSLVGDVRTWMGKIDLFLRAAYHGTVDEPLPFNRQWRAVHAACAGGTCPPAVLAFALQILPRESNVINEDGNLPLHIVCSSIPHEYQTPSQLASGLSVQIVLDLNKPGVYKMDRRGRLPIHLALSSGRTWENGVGMLVDVFPESVRIRDPCTMMFPFMLAAVSPFKDKERHASTTTTTTTKHEDDKDDHGDHHDENDDEDEQSSEQTTKNNKKKKITSSSSYENKEVKTAIDLSILNTTYTLLRHAPILIHETHGNAETLYLWRKRSELLTETESLKHQLEVTKSDLKNRMSAGEVKELDEKKKRLEVRVKEEECRRRADQLERSSGEAKGIMREMEGSIVRIRDSGV